MLQFLTKRTKKAIFFKLNTLYIHKRYLIIREEKSCQSKRENLQLYQIQH